MPIFPVLALATGHKPVISNSYERDEKPDGHPGVDIVFKDAEVAQTFSAPWWIGGPWFVPPSTPAVAWDDGYVTVARMLSGGYGVRVRHPQHNVDSLYIHLASLAVSPGDRVKAGQKVGTIGDSPKGTDVAHLHFEIRGPGDVIVDPTPYLTGKPIKASPAAPAGTRTWVAPLLVLTAAGAAIWIWRSRRRRA